MTPRTPHWPLHACWRSPPELTQSRLRLPGLSGIAVACAALLALPVQAQDAAVPDSPMALRGSPLLVEQLPAAAKGQVPSFVWGDQISGETGISTVVQGHAELRRHDTILRADELTVLHKTDDAKAMGNVSVLRNGNRYTGPELQLNLDTYEGFFATPRYEFLKTQGRGEAQRAEFKGENLSVVHNATYTTCPAPDGYLPDWWIKATRLELNQANDVGVAESGTLYFKGVPILAAPYVSFPLSDKRKSGLLPPAINLTNLSGLEITQSYYWNIAPEMDMTFSPTVMTKRGVDLRGEFRYLQPGYNGEWRAGFMPSDKLRSRDRWGYALTHQQVFGADWGLTSPGLRLNLNRVSDDDYWRDFHRASSTLTQRLLPNEAVLSTYAGPVLLSAGTYTWQTLQDSAAPITAPYDRVPQIDARLERFNQQLGSFEGMDWSLTCQATRFSTRRVQSVSESLADINGNRYLGIAQVSRLWQTPAWFVKPKAQLHLTHYQFDQSLYNGQRSASRAVPTFSLDSGLVFERDATVLGRALLQTLEPRAFYVRTPYRNQNYLPNYDSGAKDFNVGTAWTENVFGGNDRVSDVHAITLGAASRLIDPDTGVEAARFSLAQRYRFADQRVVLPGGTAVTDRLSDVLLGTALNWVPQWSFEGSVQFNPKQGRSQRTTLSARYNPLPYHVVSTAYRLQRAGGLLPPSEQLDLGWQWPLASLMAGEAKPRNPLKDAGTCTGSWYGVGRVNYSMPDAKVVDLIAGFEYDAGCWVGRVVVESLQRSAASASQRILFQLEFTGFSRIGSSPITTLRNNVPKYMLLHEKVQTPSRFGDYD